MGQCVEANVDKKSVDVNRRGQMDKGLSQVARQKDIVTQIFNGPPGILTNKHLVLDDQNSGH